ncbi:hypothetical protein CSA56_09970 [candidate division KSB3 bacterium]|uniref:Uncharacterized protein n=1 Tax=candidate division KSB3 bacterium TaxID=2044937 RepID=A0A2G6KG91_9BACT|nr:MAG: hypothetical protein CSA56_09970 [candidate division KSB3 bacterium]
MSEKVFNAGDEVDSYCMSCKLMLMHRIVAVVDGKPEKVVCGTCNRKHKYRPNLPKSRQPKTAKKTTRIRRSKDPALLWEEAMTGKDLSNPKPYSISGAFLENDIIDHKKFGPGLVMQLMGEGKMEVIFKEGTKLLVCER